MMTVLFTIINPLHPSTKAILWQHFTGKSPSFLFCYICTYSFPPPNRRSRFAASKATTQGLFSTALPPLFSNPQLLKGTHWRWRHRPREVPRKKIDTPEGPSQQFPARLPFPRVSASGGAYKQGRAANCQFGFTAWHGTSDKNRRRPSQARRLTEGHNQIFQRLKRTQEGQKDRANFRPRHLHFRTFALHFCFLLHFSSPHPHSLSRSNPISGDCPRLAARRKSRFAHVPLLNHPLNE